MVGWTWADVEVGGAFALGLLVGAVATIRLARILANFLRGQRDAAPPRIRPPHTPDDPESRD